MDDAEILNRIERRLRKKRKVSDREKRLLGESYSAFGVKMPRDIGRMLR